MDEPDKQYEIVGGGLLQDVQCTPPCKNAWSTPKKEE